MTVIPEELGRSAIDEENQREIEAAKDQIRGLFLAEPGSAAIHRSDVIERITGVRQLTDEEQKRISRCSEALSGLVMGGELTLNWDCDLIATNGLRQPVVNSQV